MDRLVLRTGGWFALALIAFAAMLAARDGGFAVHMGIVSAVALGLAVYAMRSADYAGFARGLMKMPADQGRYYDDVIRWGVIATVFWGLAGFLAGLYIALQLAFPALNLGLEYTSFGRLRPLHTSAVIFAFGGNALIATSFYVVQRTCRARLFSPKLADFVFWGYQLFIVLAATGYLLGITEGKEYAEPEWYVDLWHRHQAVRAAYLCGKLVLSRLHPDDRDAAYRQQPLHAGQPARLQKLQRLCRRAGCADAVVVRP
jgi:cytochrome c oxidase cbb3-type subunit 1